MYSKEQMQLARSVEQIVLFLLKKQFMEKSSTPPLLYYKKKLWVEISPYAVSIYSKPKTWYNTTMAPTMDSGAVISAIEKRLAEIE